MYTVCMCVRVYICTYVCEFTSLLGMNMLERISLSCPSPKVVEGEGGPIRPWPSARLRAWTLAGERSQTTSTCLVCV